MFIMSLQGESDGVLQSNLKLSNSTCLGKIYPKDMHHGPQVRVGEIFAKLLFIYNNKV